MPATDCIACSKTMRTTRLTKLNESADAHKVRRLNAGKRYGFIITSDGWKSVAKSKYHNFILIYRWRVLSSSP